MGPRVIIIGGGIGGLTAALALAENGVEVTIVERDRSLPPHDTKKAFREWKRPSVPQFRQTHGFGARMYSILCLFPGIVDRLREFGAKTFDPLEARFPGARDANSPTSFTGLLCRRPILELALREAAIGVQQIHLTQGLAATGLILERKSSGDSIVRGLLTDSGPIKGDVLIDAGGSRSRVRKWLHAQDIHIQAEWQSCGLTYYSRHFWGSNVRGRDLEIMRDGYESKNLLITAYPGDNDTFSVTIFAASWDPALRSLRNERTWMQTLKRSPSLSTLVEDAVPLTPVLVMGGHRNTLAQFSEHNSPTVGGLLVVGDALSTTNPHNGWGVSMAMTHAVSAAAAIVAEGSDEVELSYYDAILPETRAVYWASCIQDRCRNIRWGHVPATAADAPDLKKDEFLRRLETTMWDQPRLLQAFLRRNSLLEPPDAIFEHADVLNQFGLSSPMCLS